MIPKLIDKKNLKYNWKACFFVLPSILLLAVFAYFPVFSAIYHSFFLWDGISYAKYIGDFNFRYAFGHYWIWLGLIITLYCCIIYGDTANKKSNFIRRIGGVLFPLIAIGLVMKNNYVSNSSLESYYGASIIIWGAIVLLSSWLISSKNNYKWIIVLTLGVPLLVTILQELGMCSIFAWLAITLLLGFGLWIIPAFNKLPHIEIARTAQSFMGVIICMCCLASYTIVDESLWYGFGLVFILVAFNVLKMIPSAITAVVIHRLKSDKMTFIYRVLFVIPFIIPSIVYLLVWKFFFDPNIGPLNKIIFYTKIHNLLVWLDGIMHWGGAFSDGIAPGWLGDEKLVIPAIIIWGFPWIGIIGVMLYLSGLRNIPKSIYEASELDGATSLQQFFHIEFPLILSQIKIQLVLMVIETLKSFSFIYILFGHDGGPSGRLMLPGLLMFKKAFVDENAGYACVIGLIIFVFILLLTEFNNRYIKITK